MKGDFFQETRGYRLVEALDIRLVGAGSSGDLATRDICREIACPDCDKQAGGMGRFDRYAVRARVDAATWISRRTPQAAHRKRVPAVAEVELPFAEIEEDRSNPSPPARALGGEPVEMFEIRANHGRRRLDLDSDLIVRTLREDIDLAPTLVTPVVEAKIVGLIWRRSEDLGEDEALRQAAERSGVAVDAERAWGQDREVAR